MKKVMFVLPVMRGGGAERVAAQIANTKNKRGIDVSFLLTSETKETVMRTDLAEEIPLILLQESVEKGSSFQGFLHKISHVFASLLCKPFEALKKPVPADFAKLSLMEEYRGEIKAMRNILLENQDATIIAFLQPTIPIVLLAAQKTDNRIILSERGNPQRLMKKRYGRRFIEKYYQRANTVVFQTEDAKAVYPENLAQKGVVISNPIKEGLPEPYHGERNKYITTFCRISKQKNLPNLLSAFAIVHQKHPDYQLRIIGDTFNDEGEEVLKELHAFISENDLQKHVLFEPFKKNVHEAIIKDQMYVNSSDYEGISNAMLEATAIGMPVVCTDCPIGGAKAAITDGENGLLVPIKDANALANAINRVIEDRELAEKLSNDASKIRDEITLDKITDKWEALL